MGKIWMPGGGGGADLDAVTVTDPSDVLAGKVIVDKEGNSLTGTLALSGNASDDQVLSGQTYYNSAPKTKRTGTMPNRGSVSQALNAGGSYTIPAGYHNGSGKVTANSLSSQTSGTAAAAQILSGCTAWVNGSKITGSIASLAGQTITPGTSQQTLSSSGKYMTGNVVVAGDVNLVSKYIIANKSIFGVSGSTKNYQCRSGTTTSGSSKIALEKSSSTYWYYGSVTNLDITPIMVLSISDAVVWLYNKSAVANYGSTKYNGYASDVNTSVWTCTSSKVMLPSATANSNVWYWIFGY